MIPKAQSKDGYGTKLNKDFKITPSMIPMIEDYLAKDTMEVEVPDVELTEKQVKHNNTGVRKPIPIELNDLHIAEWIKCSRDPVYFIKKYCYIISLDDGLIKFKLFPYQEKLIRKFQKYRFNIPMQSRQTGKALALDTPVLTPDGFSDVGSLKVGDKIFGRDGKETNITFITEVMNDRECYEIEFDNGETIVADAEHLWNFNHNHWNCEKTITTKEAIEYQNKYKSQKKGSSLYIDYTKPVEFKNKGKLDIDPYILGLWLGDGYSDSGRIACHKDDYDFYSKVIAECSDFSLDYRSKTTGRFNIENLNKQLRINGLKNNKHIPVEYIHTSIENRLELLRGLMDSDGYSDKRTGACEFYQKDKGIIKQFRYLLSTLGIKSRCSEKSINGEIYSTVRFTTNSYDVFKLERKLENQRKSKNHPKQTRIYVKSFKLVDSVPVRCLQVDNDDHMFLCGETLIPTHNTTTSAAFILWYAIFHGAKNVAILANKQAQAQETVERVTTMLENLPFFLQPGNKTLNKRSMEFGNKSKIFSAATSSSSIRGQSVNLLYLDEFAHVQNDVQFFESTYPVITSGKKTRAIITSTPNGAKGMFYKLWKDSEEKKNSYKRTLVIWNEVPGRDKKWAEETRRNIGGEAQWRQEFLCEFVGTVGSLISGSVLQAIPSQEPISVEGDDLCLSIFEEAQEDHIYMMTVDVSRGVGNDYSAVIVTDVSVAPYKIVARYKNNLIDANLFPDVIYAIGSRYNNAYAVVETNDLGETVVNTLWDEFEYENIVSTYSVKGKGQVATLGYSSKNVFGVKTTASTKRIGCANLKSLVEDGTYLINDLACQTELSTFIQKNNSFQADEGCHDDLAMCLVIFSWFTGQDLFKNLTDDSIRDKLLEKMKRDQYQDMMPVIPNTEEELSFLVEDGDVWVTEDHPEFGSYFTPNQF